MCTSFRTPNSILAMATFFLLANIAPFAAAATIHPTGTYQPARIQLLQAGSDRVMRTISGGFRNGRLPVQGHLSARHIIGHLVREDMILRGSFTVVQHQQQTQIAYTITGFVAADGTVTGTWNSDKAATGKLTGSIQENTELRQKNSIPTHMHWPQWNGPTHNLVAPASTTPLILHLDQAQQAWRSEQGIDGGQGSLAAFWRMGDYITHNAFAQPTGAGGASPIVYDGRVYLYYFRPTPDGPFHPEALKVWKNLRFGTPSGSLEADFDDADDLDLGITLEEDEPDAEWSHIPVHVREKYSYVADEVMICVDAATGQTLWQTVLARSGINRQDHKLGPVGFTPCTDGKRVYSLGTKRTVRAFDCQSGALVWEATMPTAPLLGEDKARQYWGWGYLKNLSHSPVMIDGLVVVGDHLDTLYAFDAETGQERWRLAKGIAPACNPAAWKHQGKTWILTTVKPYKRDAEQRSALQAIDPQTGTIAWQIRGNFVTKGFGIHGDMAVLLENHVSPKAATDGKEPGCDVVALQLSPTEATRLWAHHLPGKSAPSSHWLPLVTDKLVYLSGIHTTVTLHAATGKPVSSSIGPGAINEGIGTLAGDHLLIRRDGCHTGNSMVLVHGNQSTFSHAPLSQPPANPEDPYDTFIWLPPHPHTNSYHSKPISLPLVDGRLFMRGRDGIYCYDLRAYDN